MDESRSYARTRVAVAPGDSTSSLKKSATATRRWTRDETRARVVDGPEFPHPRPTPSQLDDQVHGYEQATGDRVRTQAKRNLLAACYRLHGDDFLPLVAEWFGRTGTTTNLLGELRVLPPRDSRPVEAAGSDWTDVVEPSGPIEQPGPEPGPDAEPFAGAAAGVVNAGTSEIDADSAWCSCPEEELQPGLLYCAEHHPKFGSFPKLRYDRRESNPAAAHFLVATAGHSSPGAPKP